MFSGLSTLAFTSKGKATSTERRGACKEVPNISNKDKRDISARTGWTSTKRKKSP